MFKDILRERQVNNVYVCLRCNVVIEHQATRQQQLNVTRITVMARALYWVLQKRQLLTLKV